MRHVRRIRKSMTSTVTLLSASVIFTVMLCVAINTIL